MYILIYFSSFSLFSCFVFISNLFLNRKLFQEEIKQNPANEDSILEMKRKEAEEFKLLLEENAKENERIKIVR